jgi:hypothetical protein
MSEQGERPDEATGGGEAAVGGGRATRGPRSARAASRSPAG